MSVVAPSALITVPARAGAQAAAPSGAATAQSQSGSSSIPDLSGDWLRGGPVQSISPSDPAGRLRGKEPDIPYKPETLVKTLSEVPPTGPDAMFEQNTDPSIHFCEPLGLARIYMYPAKTKFIQTPEAVYILPEIGPAFRIVWLNVSFRQARVSA